MKSSAYPIACLSGYREVIVITDSVRMPRDFIKPHGQELDDQVIDSSISLYVNELSLPLVGEG